MPALAPVQGTAIAIDDKGVLIVGPSGSGKSLLALQLLQSAKLAQLPAYLISDDLVYLARDDAKLILNAPDRLQGQIELRGAGIISRAFKPSATLNVLVEFVDQTERLPDERQLTGVVEGVKVSRVRVMPFPKMSIEQQVFIVRHALDLD